MLGGTRRQLLEQAGADPAALVVVRDGERRLGDHRVAQAHVVGDRDDALGAVDLERAEQGAALVPVGLEQRLDEARAEVGEAVEAEVETPLRQRPKEVEQRVGVVLARRAQPERAPVPEYHIGRELLRAHGPEATSDEGRAAGPPFIMTAVLLRSRPTRCRAPCSAEEARPSPVPHRG